ncbi:MAG: paraquat-inducible protein A [Halioglobus sp.]|jgi:paraquat-inducible protein A
MPQAILGRPQMVCHECDLLVDLPQLAFGEKAHCPRCRYLLMSNRKNAGTIVFAFSVSALLFLILSSAFPFLGFSAGGQSQTITLLESINVLATEKFPGLAAIVFAFTIAIPAVFLVGVIYVSSSISLRQLLPGTKGTLRLVLRLIPWSMAEIFLIGILVSFIKIVSLADVALGLSFWSYFLFTISMTVVVSHLDKRGLWRDIESLDHG